MICAAIAWTEKCCGSRQAVHADSVTSKRHTERLAGQRLPGRPGTAEAERAGAPERGGDRADCRLALAAPAGARTRAWPSSVQGVSVSL